MVDGRPSVFIGFFAVGSVIAGIFVVIARLLFTTPGAVEAIFGFSVLALVAAAGFLAYARYAQAEHKREQLESHC